MKKIELNDLISQPNIQQSQNLIELPTSSKPKKVTLQDHFFNLNPQTDLEKNFFKVMNKKVANDKIKENIAIARFDSKMRRMNKIKSKTYRKMRRKEKINEEFIEQIQADNEIEERNIEEENENKENNVDEENLFCKKNENILNENLLIENSNVTEYVSKNKFFEKLLNKKQNFSKTNDNTLVFDNKQNNLEKQREIAKEMFKESEDDFENKFKEEKKEIFDEEAPSITKEILPGWNSWGGTGLEIVETKYNTIIKKKEGIDIEKRKDYASEHIIINENNKKLDDKYKVELPFGYTEEEYKMKMEMPVTKNRNSLRVFNKLIKNEPGYLEYQSQHK
ncbi:hypothetical protein GVAV_002254 [Gurleya vavrai]